MARKYWETVKQRNERLGNTEWGSPKEVDSPPDEENPINEGLAYIKKRLRVELVRTSVWEIDYAEGQSPHEDAQWDAKSECFYIELEDALYLYDPIVLTTSRKQGYDYHVELYDKHRE